MFKIVWEKNARNELAEVLKFWVKHNKSNSYSIKIFEEVELLQNLLEKHPFIGSITDYKDIRRILVLKKFSLFYTVESKTITILSFWDNNQNPDNINIKLNK